MIRRKSLTLPQRRALKKIAAGDIVRIGPVEWQRRGETDAPIQMATLECLALRGFTKFTLQPGPLLRRTGVKITWRGEALLRRIA